MSDTVVFNQLEKAKLIVNKIAPDHRADLSCMLMASAIAGQLGLTMRHIRIGALYWPEKFKDDPHLSMRGGWGCEGYSDGRLWLADPTVDEEGSFSGHTWLEPEADTVVDLMHDNEHSAREIYNSDFKLVAHYIPRRGLERAVKNFWRREMLAAIKQGGG